MRHRLAGALVLGAVVLGATGCSTAGAGVVMRVDGELVYVNVCGAVESLEVLEYEGRDVVIASLPGDFDPSSEVTLDPATPGLSVARELDGEATYEISTTPAGDGRPPSGDVVFIPGEIGEGQARGAGRVGSADEILRRAQQGACP